MATIPTKPTAATAADVNGSSNDDFLLGTASNDIIYGAAGFATGFAADGIDTMQGGAGDDIYMVNNVADVVTEFVTEGVDTIFSTVSYTLSSEVENLVAVSTAADKVFTGNAGNNILDGTQNAVGDTLQGMAGNDTYVMETGDTVIEGKLASATATQYTDTGGIDKIESATSVDISALITDDGQLPGADTPDAIIGQAFIENVTLTGTTATTITGNAKNNTLVGNSIANSITGGAGNDILDGGKNTVVGVADTFNGGLGNDTYISRNDADTSFTEGLNEGTDTILGVFTTGTVNASANIENITLIGTTSIGATGNSLANTINGNNGSNTLTGGTGTVVDTLNGLQGTDLLIGGAGADKMTGGKGNDTYSVDSTTDVVTELANAVINGTDTVVSSATYTLNSAAAFGVENITLGTLTSSGGGGATTATIVSTGTTAINATGNALANTIIGNDGNNILDGGVGADAMTGNGGNDTYIVDNTLDTVTEAASGGTADIVKSSVDFTLPTEVENLTLTGTTAIDGTGNASNNIIIGNAGINIITGGAGQDTVTTGAGADTIKFAAGVADTVAGAASVADIDWFKDLSLNGSTADQIDITAAVDSVGKAVSGQISSATFIADMSTALEASANGTGFKVATAGITAAVVTATTGSGGVTTGDKFLAIDLNSNGTFEATDFVIEITGSTVTSLTLDTFI